MGAERSGIWRRGVSQARSIATRPPHRDRASRARWDPQGMDPGCYKRSATPAGFARRASLRFRGDRERLSGLSNRFSAPARSKPPWRLTPRSSGAPTAGRQARPGPCRFTKGRPARLSAPLRPPAKVSGAVVGAFGLRLIGFRDVFKSNRPPSLIQRAQTAIKTGAIHTVTGLPLRCF